MSTKRSAALGPGVPIPTYSEPDRFYQSTAYDICVGWSGPVSPVAKHEKLLDDAGEPEQGPVDVQTAHAATSFQPLQTGGPPPTDPWVVSVGDPLRTLADASPMVGVPVWQLRRAIAKGLLPAYRPFGRRIYVRLAEIETVISFFRIGGRR